MTKSLSAHRRTNRPGLTLVEVLVVVSIVGMLAAIAIPAVNAARENGRRVNCTNNFKQFGTGLISYEAANRCYFTMELGPSTPHTAILPYLGYNDVYQSLDVERFRGMAVYADFAAAIRLGMDRVPIFRCPSDPQEITDADGWPGNNVRVCCGIYDFDAYAPGQNYRQWKQRAGLFSTWDIRSQDVLDGASRTIAASEKLMGSGVGAGFSPRRDYIYTGLGPSSSLFYNPDLDLMVATCQAAATTANPTYYPYSGVAWVVEGYDCTMYNHVFTPNSRIPDCTSNMRRPPLVPEAGEHGAGIFTATSNHPGGVNVLFLDGHTEFVINDVDLSIWRAFATRAAGD